MKRKTFLHQLGLAGAAAVLPGQVMSATQWAAQKSQSDGGCVLIPSETAGPFPLDLTENPFFFRQDVREDRAGVILNLKMRIIGIENCQPMPNLRVNIWHCDKDGLYSGYNESVGLTFCRGYQMTDAYGEVSFTTIFPGWYPGRICHIHFQVFVSSVYAAISQLTFPLEEKTALYNAHSDIYTEGPDPLNFNQDGVFADGYNYQLCTLTPNETDGYDAYLELGIQGSGVATGLAALTPETGGQFTLGQNFPNPYLTHTIIPFELLRPSDVKIELYDLSARKMAEVLNARLEAGAHKASIDISSLHLPAAPYIYQIEVANEKGIYRQCKMMTAAR